MANVWPYMAFTAATGATPAKVSESNPLAVYNIGPQYLSGGNITGVSLVHKFGYNEAVGSSWEPICRGGLYRTLQPASATTLRVKAGNTNDTTAGTGAREVTLVGLDETGAEVTSVLATAGTSASSATSATYIRLYRAYVSASGTYATVNSLAPSQAAAIVIENGAGGTDWATIGSTGTLMGQSEIACYSVPLGKTAFVEGMVVHVDSNTPADLMLVKRESILDAAAPYEAMRIQTQIDNIGESTLTLKPDNPWGPFPALTDLMWLGKAASPAIMTLDFEIVLEDT